MWEWPSPMLLGQGASTANFQKTQIHLYTSAYESIARATIYYQSMFFLIFQPVLVCVTHSRNGWRLASLLRSSGKRFINGE